MVERVGPLAGRREADAAWWPNVSSIRRRSRYAARMGAPFRRVPSMRLTRLVRAGESLSCEMAPCPVKEEMGGCGWRPEACGVGLQLTTTTTSSRLRRDACGGVWRLKLFRLKQCERASETRDCRTPSPRGTRGTHCCLPARSDEHVSASSRPAPARVPRSNRVYMRSVALRCNTDPGLGDDSPDEEASRRS